MHHDAVAMRSFRLIKRNFLAVSAAYLLSGAAFGADALSPDQQPAAGPASQTQDLRFSTLDLNHDGVIDAAEAAASPDLAKVLPSADANKDGQLSLEEFTVAISLLR